MNTETVGNAINPSDLLKLIDQVNQNRPAKTEHETMSPGEVQPITNEGVETDAVLPSVGRYVNVWA